MATAAARVDVRARGVGPLLLCAAAAFLVGSFLLGVLVGPVHIGVGGVLGSMGGRLRLPGVSSSLSPTEDSILWDIRIPRVVLGALVGGMLALAGATYQGVFRNPLADPYLLGVAAGAGLGATLAIAYLPAGLRGQRLLPVAAFAGAVCAVAGAYVLGRSVGGVRTTGALILAGVTVAAFMTAIQTFVQQQRSETLREVYSWILGGLSGASWQQVVLVTPYITFSVAVL